MKLWIPDAYISRRNFLLHFWAAGSLEKEEGSGISSATSQVNRLNIIQYSTNHQADSMEGKVEMDCFVL
jgi:hypothetical protein